MPTASAEVVHQVEILKTDIGWSWTEVMARLAWSPIRLRNFRDMKQGMDDDEYRYLSDVAAAVKAVPPPTVSDQREFASEMPILPRAPLPADGPESDPSPVRQIRVMTLEDIAHKLAEEYAAVVDEPSISGLEVASARWAISRLAEKFGVVAEVKALIAEGKGAEVPATAPKLSRPAFPAVPVPVPSRAVQPRSLPADDREEYSPPGRQTEAREPFANETF
jgi:hypothetical protein